MIQQKVRKKKKSVLICSCWRKIKLDCPLYSKKTNLKGVYFRNKVWLLKSLVTLKCDSRTSLHAAQYK